GIFILLYAVFGRFIWRPGTRFIKRIRRYLGRHEVWFYLLTWGICALIGLILSVTWWIFNSVLIAMLLAVVAAGAFAVVCFRSPVAGLLSYLVAAPALKSVFYFKLAAGIPLFTTDAIAIMVLLVVYFVHPKKDTAHGPTRLLHWLMALFILGELVAAMRTDVPKKSAALVLDGYMTPMIIYLFARRWISDVKRLQAFFLMMALIGSYFFVFALPEHFTGRNYFSHSGRSAYVETTLGTVRAQGPATSPEEFGLTLVLVFLVALVWMPYAPGKRKVLLVLLAIACLVGIAYTLRRSVYLGFGLGLLMMLMSSPKVRRNAAITITCFVLALAVGWQTLIHSEVYSKRFMTTNPLLNRAVLYATAWNIVKHHPFLGLGYRKFGEGSRKYLVGYKDILQWYGNDLPDPHSSYWTILVEAGILTFVPFCGVFFMMFYTSYLMYKRVRAPGLLGRDGIIVFWAYTLGVLSQAGSTSTFYYDRYLIVLIYFYFGALVGTHLRVRDLAAEPVTQTRRTPAVPAPSRAIGG
ncbi:MAG: O-antigen ligase family protein, partial [Armatimonadetes bacterium]|nr:O-antigen ligase family protein [Armatimonadota bacterium]